MGTGLKTTIRIGTLLAAFVTAACGGSTTQSSASVGTAGGVVTTDNVRLDIPAGALQVNTQVTVRETQPPAGTVRRVEIEPHGLVLGSAARVSVKDDGSQTPVKLVGTSNQGTYTLGRCCHDMSWHQHSGDLTTLGTVDLAHATPCDPACTNGLVCENGACVQPDAFCSYCGQACGPSGCDGWMCGCNGGMCGCHTDGGVCCNGSDCCNGDMCGGHH